MAEWLCDWPWLIGRETSHGHKVGDMTCLGNLVKELAMVA